MSRQQIKQAGFTIIEVVLVLAIAALIFLMVFIALPALQRSQKDAARKSDLSRAITALNSWQSNNRGALPTISPTNTYGTQDANGAASPTTSLLARYLLAGGDEFRDPSGKPYTFVLSPATLPTTADATMSDESVVRIFVSEASTCNGEGITDGQGNRKVAFRIVLEGGGVLCQSN